MLAALPTPRLNLVIIIRDEVHGFSSKVSRENNNFKEASAANRTNRIKSLKEQGGKINSKNWAPLSGGEYWKNLTFSVACPCQVIIVTVLALNNAWVIGPAAGGGDCFHSSIHSYFTSINEDYYIRGGRVWYLLTPDFLSSSDMGEKCGDRVLDLWPVCMKMETSTESLFIWCF